MKKVTGEDKCIGKNFVVKTKQSRFHKRNRLALIYPELVFSLAVKKK